MDDRATERTSAGSQLISVAPERWGSALAACPDVVSSLDGRHSVDRSWVRTFEDAPALDRLAASMVWGFGPVAYGPHRVGEMLATPDAALIVEDIRAACADGPRRGFASLFTDGRPRLKWLGVAFGTKFLAFVTEPDGPDSAYVYDKYVWKGLQTVDSPPSIPDPGGYVGALQYEEYCLWLAERAARDGWASAEDLEYKLFDEGKAR